MRTNEQKNGKLLLYFLEKRSMKEIRRFDDLNTTLDLLVECGCLHEAKEVARLLWRELNRDELMVILLECFKKGRHNEAKDALSMMLVLDAKKREGLFVVE